jgi:hypothetical protein
MTRCAGEKEEVSVCCLQRNVEGSGCFVVLAAKLAFI